MSKKTSNKVDRTPDRKESRTVLDATRSIDSLGPLSTTLEHRKAAAKVVENWINANVEPADRELAFEDIAGALGVFEFIKL